MLRLLRSNVGLKAIMAVTGLIWVGYLITHVAANLLVFTGPTLINRYSAALHAMPALLWGARIVLIVAIVAHVVAAVVLTRRERAARPVGYSKWEPQVSTFASRTIRWGGLAILFLLVFHILHLTTGSVHPAFVEGDPYGNVVRGFRHPAIAALYLVFVVAVGLHLFHGSWSAFRSLGLVKPSSRPLQHKTSLLVAGAIWLGFTVIPIAVLIGLVR
jgi:succinate dehydrogenase / fumarate reductase, cytochrome b subunit